MLQWFQCFRFQCFRFSCFSGFNCWVS